MLSMHLPQGSVLIIPSPRVLCSQICSRSTPSSFRLLLREAGSSPSDKNSLPRPLILLYFFLISLPLDILYLFICLLPHLPLEYKLILTKGFACSAHCCSPGTLEDCLAHGRHWHTCWIHWIRIKWEAIQRKRISWSELSLKKIHPLAKRGSFPKGSVRIFSAC